MKRTLKALFPLSQPVHCLFGLYLGSVLSVQHRGFDLLASRKWREEWLLFINILFIYEYVNLIFWYIDRYFIKAWHGSVWPSPPILGWLKYKMMSKPEELWISYRRAGFLPCHRTAITTTFFLIRAGGLQCHTLSEGTCGVTYSPNHYFPLKNAFCIFPQKTWFGFIEDRVRGTDILWVHAHWQCREEGQVKWGQPKGKDNAYPQGTLSAQQCSESSLNTNKHEDIC